MLAKIYDNLAPGGWAEFQEWGAECVGEDAVAEERYQQSPFHQWLQYLVAGGAAIGRDFHATRKFKNWSVQYPYPWATNIPISKYPPPLPRYRNPERDYH